MRSSLPSQSLANLPPVLELGASDDAPPLSNPANVPTCVAEAAAADADADADVEAADAEAADADADAAAPCGAAS